MESLEKLAPNIRVIDFNDEKLQHLCEPHNFKTDVALLNAEIGCKSREISILDFLKLSNTDGMMGFLLDFMRTLMLYAGHDALISSDKVRPEEISEDIPIVYLDFDFYIRGPISKFETPYGIRCEFSNDIQALRQSFFGMANNAIVVTQPNHPALKNTLERIRGYFNREKLF
ncbi:hypothetical protein [Wolbachia endosymbiont of Pentidionis agamae]|uniref:hypothetical protein n=1 Tax=Wolbachia endosymbiont of Pentidionis agamae TaxID=3110435 RepID=UPI002FD2FFF2